MPDDIRSLLESAVNAQTGDGGGDAPGPDAGGGDGSVDAAPASAGPVGVADSDAGADGATHPPESGPERPRGPDGKFLPKPEADKTEAPKAAKPVVTPRPVAARPAATGVPAQAVTTPAPAEPPKQEYIDHKGRRIDIAKAPKSFGPLVREKWASLPLEMRADLARREADVAQSIGPAVENRTFRESFQQVVAPYAAMIQAGGGDPVKYTQTLYQTAYRLQAGTPAQKQETWAGLARDFGIPIDAATVAHLIRSANVPIEALAQALDGKGAPQVPQATINPDEIIRQAEERAYQRMVQAQQQNQQAQLHREAQTFGADKEFFEDIREDMADLLDRGRAKTLEEAYNRALLMHKADPESQVGEVLRQREAQKSAQAAVASTQRAKAAASSVRSQPTGTQPGGQPKDVRGTIEAAIAAHSGR